MSIRRLAGACALACALACAALLAPSVAHATLLERLGTRALMARSATVVLADVRSVAARADGGMVVTDVELAVASSFKGSAGPYLRITVPGGAVAGRTTSLEGGAVFRAGDRCFLFLDAEGRLLGGWQGKADVVDGMVSASEREFTSLRTSQSEAAFADYLRCLATAGVAPASAGAGGELEQRPISPLQVRPCALPPGAPVGALAPASSYAGVATLFSDDFERGYPGKSWIMRSYPEVWSLDTTRAASGTHSLHTNAALWSGCAGFWGTFGAGNVAFLDLDVLTDLDPGQNFWVEVTDYTTVPPRVGYVYFTGHTHGWEHFEIDLAHLDNGRGGTIDLTSANGPVNKGLVNVCMYSGGTGSGSGVWVDNVVLSRGVAGVRPVPVISSVTPGVQGAGVGATITITGTNFGTSPGKLTFYAMPYHQRIDARPLTWTDRRIVAQVPVGNIGWYLGSPSSGPLSVTRSDGRRSNSVEFRVLFGTGGEKWATRVVRYRINDVGGPGFAAAVRAAAATWSRPSSIEITESGTCTTTDTVAADGFNDVYWATGMPPGLIGATFLTETSGTTIVERDMALSTDYPWGDATTDAYAMDVQTIVTHEFGHWLGLRDVYGLELDWNKVMFGFGGEGSVLRDLSAGEVRGIDYLYGGGRRAQVTRIGGADRYEVAVRSAAAVFPGWKNMRHIIVASGDDRAAADPLSAAGVAGVYHAPILLTGALVLNSRTATAVGEIAAANPGVAVHIVGGPGSVSAAVAGQLAAIPGVALVDRMWGVDRYGTAAAVAERMHGAFAGQIPKVVILANGNDPTKFYDALAASPMAARMCIPILLVRTTSVPWRTTYEMGRLGVPSSGRILVGNTLSVNETVRKTLGVPLANRWYGADRCGTACSVARHTRTMGWLTYDTTGVANRLPDALTGGTAMGLLGGPILFTPATVLDASTQSAITLNSPEVLGVTAFGGPASLSAPVVSRIDRLLR